MKSELNGQVSLVTGAARGIGLAIADRLAANGSRVFYTDIDEAELSKTLADRPQSAGCALDVTNSEQIESVTRRVVEDFGRLDILVNNAGVNTMKYRVTIDEFPRDVRVRQSFKGPQVEDVPAEVERQLATLGLCDR